MLSLRRLDLDDCDWERMDELPDRRVFQTREWLEFLVRTQYGEPVVAEVLDRRDVVGYFTGMVVKRYGVRILGSPFPGWTTGPMGFNLSEGTSRAAALEALPRFAFGQLRCLHLEIMDRHLSADDAGGLGFRREPFPTFEIDLTREEDEIFAGMRSGARRAIRKSEKVGVEVEEASGEEFADEYYDQLTDVFAKQSLTPTYDVERVRELVRCIHPSGRLLLLRALSPDGEPSATGIFPAMNGTAYFWGGASWRSQQIHRPNEAIFWYAMRYWKKRGVKVLDLGGGGEYKRKFGVSDLTVPFFRKSRFAGLMSLRDIAERVSTRGR